MLPTPIVFADRIRVYFSSCDTSLRGRIYYADLDRHDPRVVLQLSHQPSLDLGESGAFDADGVNPGHIVARDGALYLYYIGWRRRSAECPYTLFTGLAISDDGGCRFRRYSRDPVLLPTLGETLFRTAPHVFPYREGWGMLYIGGRTFLTNTQGKRLPIYNLCITYSWDGTVWGQAGKVLMEPDPSTGQIGFGRPAIWHDNGEQALLISTRRESGYVQLIGLPGKSWREVVPFGGNGWDSEMTCFGAPCAVDNREYLFYNGNQFGHTGFGVACRPSERASSGGVADLMEYLTASASGRRA